MTDKKNKKKEQSQGKEEQHSKGEKMEELQAEMRAVRREVGQLIEQQNQIVRQQTQIESLLKEIVSLKEENNKQSQEIVQLKSRVDELEQYTRAEDIIISGLKVQNRSYARASTVTEEVGESAREDENLALEKQVINFMASKDIVIKEEQVSACHFLGGMDKNGVKKIVMRFVNRKDKVAVLKARKVKLDGSDVYVSEHLTKKNANLARLARTLKKRGHIIQTWTRNGKVFSKWKSPINEQEMVTKINTEEDFLKCDITRETLDAVCVKLHELPKHHGPHSSSPSTTTA
jgi:hypothetical protein